MVFASKGTESDIADAELVLFSVGYEARSTFMARSHHSRSQRWVGIGFGSRQVLSFEDNLAWVQSHAVEYHEVGSSVFPQWIRSFAASISDVSSICIDISSFNRDRLGVIVSAFRSWAALSPDRKLTICYAAASFTALNPVAKDNGQLVGSAELLQEFEGDYVDPSIPLTAILGLGFEPGRALGSIELVEAPLITAFVPYGVDARFDEAVVRANQSLLTRSGRVAAVAYDVLAPWDLYAELSRLVQGLTMSGRTTIIPLGPKIFCAVALLVVADAAVQPPVWRVSAGSQDRPTEAEAAGPIAVMNLTLEGSISDSGCC